MDIRVGQGFDIHRFSDDPDRPLILGGQRFAGRGLIGHSDSDVIAHACADALLGAAALGDLGQLFPDSDPAYADADSIALLADVAERVHDAGWIVANIDCSVVTDEPKLAPARVAMQRALSAAVDAPVTVKGRRPEGLGALGRAEGIACFASVILTRP